MKSSFKLKDGSMITVTALHAAKHVMVEKIYPLRSWNDPQSFFIPPELSGVVAQAIELAGQAVINGPCRVQPADYNRLSDTNLRRGMADPVGEIRECRINGGISKHVVMFDHSLPVGTELFSGAA